MKLQISRTVSNIFTILFVVAIFLLFFISSLSYKQIISLNDAEQQVMHTYKVQILLEQLFSFTKDAETGQRGFIITKDSSFLQPYYNSRHKIDSVYNDLRALTNENAEQQKNLNILKPLINRRFELLGNLLAESNAPDFNAHNSNTRAKMLAGKVVMDMLRQQLNKMITAEETILEQRQKAHNSVLYLTPFFSLLLLFFSLMIFVAAFYKINKDVKVLKDLNYELLLTTESFDHAEKIAHISHWEWDLETDKLTYSDNHYFLLGCLPGEFEPTVENYLKFVHPDDKHLILRGADKVQNDHQASEVIFRIIRKDGVIRYLRSTGKILTDNLGKKIIVGINYDITEQYLSSKAVEEKNTELLRSNIELASFNHVASHDLQEPLRIIQLYISRIFEDSKLLLSEKNADYFKRIQLSANRMQVLIDDLLEYSRLNNTDKIFEEINLNTVVEVILTEMTQIIEEKNAVIHYNNLPNLQGIPFQLEQLFTNLITNALKYSAPDRTPVINIESTIVKGSQVPHNKADNESKYYKISVLDNGMGFEQEYAEKIFTLFQRLHDKQSFSGTGIGLAICKKIAETHMGFINAKGDPGKGSAFIVYLPA